MRVYPHLTINGVSARDVAAVETLRNWLECAEEGKDAKHLGPGWFAEELGRMCERLRERIAGIDELVARAKPN